MHKFEEDDLTCEKMQARAVKNCVRKGCNRTAVKSTQCKEATRKVDKGQKKLVESKVLIRVPVNARLRMRSINPFCICL